MFTCFQCLWTRVSNKVHECVIEWCIFPAGHDLRNDHTCCSFHRNDRQIPGHLPVKSTAPTRLVVMHKHIQRYTNAIFLNSIMFYGTKKKEMRWPNLEGKLLCHGELVQVRFWWKFTYLSVFKMIQINTKQKTSLINK